MRAFAYSLIALAAVATEGARADWSSRAQVLTATQTFSEKLDLFVVVMQDASPTAALADQWRSVRQQTDALEALIATNATFDEVTVQYKKLGTVLTEARRLMWLEGVTYYPKVMMRYQATRLAYRRLDRNMHGLPDLY